MTGRAIEAGSGLASGTGGLARLALARPRLLLVLLCLCVYVPGWFSMPPLDRDESRFAQASKQMLETADFVGIRYQAGQRNKKPAGIHWLQSASAALAGGPEVAGIWAYRLPSVVGAIAAVLVLYTLMAPLVGPPTALLGAALTASSLSLVAEANISKTDAVLLLTVVAAQGVLLKAYLAARAGDTAPLSWGSWAIFWLAISGGILIKGPIQPMVVGLTMLALSLWDREGRWLLKLRPGPGLALTALLVLPWGLAIFFDTGGRFYKEAVGTDFMKKIFRGMESHGAPPGYYATLGWVTFWPATLFLLPALVRAWTRRREPLIRFLLCWIVPSWLVFELVMTKLPHYSLPTYPAFAFLVALALMAWSAGGERPPGIARWISLGLWTLAAAGLFAALVWLPLEYGQGLHPLALAGLAAMAVLGLWTVASALQGRLVRAAVVAVGAGVATVITAFELTGPRLTDLDVSRRLAEAVRMETGTRFPPVASSGYAEPSLVFLLGTDTKLVPAAGAAAFLAETPGAVAIIEAREEAAFLAAAAERGLAPRAVARLSGHAYSNGRDVTLTLYRAGAAS